VNDRRHFAAGGTREYAFAYEDSDWQGCRTVLARDDENGVTLSPEEEAELLLSIAEADRGDSISAEEVLQRLARRHG
jgi:hypothetical protein